MTGAGRVRPAPGVGRAVLGTQIALLIAYTIGSYGILILAAVRTHDLGALLHPGLERLGDPKDSLPGLGPDSVGNPLIWIFGICRLIAWFVYPLGFAMLLSGTVTLLHARRREDRRMVVRLAVLTAIWLVLIIVAISPYGAHLMTWLLD